MKKKIDDRKLFSKKTEILSTRLGKDKKILTKSINFATAMQKYFYPYLWSWMGVPIIQNPADILVNQEIIYKLKPDIIIETGIARGGSLIFYASILSMVKKKFKVIEYGSNLFELVDSFDSDYYLLVARMVPENNLTMIVNGFIRSNSSRKLIVVSDLPKTDYLAELEIMAKGQDSKKNVKKAPAKTAKEKKEEKRLKKAK